MRSPIVHSRNIPRSDSGSQKKLHIHSARNSALNAFLANTGNQGTLSLLYSNVFQAKLKVGPANDSYERQANRVAEQVLKMPEQSTQSENTNNNARRQNITTRTGATDSNRLLGSTGRPLSRVEQTYFEPRFGADFTNVRIHDGAHAAKLAQSMNARAFTLGRDIVLGESQYKPATREGRQLMAHELTHTLQQKTHSTIIQRLLIPQPQTPSRSSFSLPLPQTQAPSISPLSVQRRRPTAPPRGRNPSICLLRECNRLNRLGVPINRIHMIRAIRNWRDRSQSCVRQGAAGSNASHYREIQQNNIDELREWASTLEGNVRGQPLSDSMRALREMCMVKQREAELEFHYNIVFENSPRHQEYWGYGDARWDAVARALSLLPDDALWASPRLIRLRRETVHPTVPGAGGDADLETAVIRIFNIGLGAQPYPRSTTLNLPSTTQSLLHEIGHLVTYRIPQHERDYFFHRFMHWYETEWILLTSRTPTPEKRRLQRLLGGGTQLDTWLRGLVLNQPYPQGRYTFVKRRYLVPGAPIYYLQFYETASVPSGPEFEYARGSRLDYLAELYALANTRPQFLHQHLSPDQVVWLKRVVFQTPTNRTELASEFAHRASTRGSLLGEWLTRGSVLFTWRQLDRLFNQLMTQSRTRVGGMVA